MGLYDDLVPGTAPAPAAAAPTTPPPKKGGLYDDLAPGAKPIGHVTTPFADPSRKPMFDTAAIDAQIAGQNAAAGKTMSALGTQLARPLGAVENKFGGHQHIMDVLNRTNIGVLPTSPQDVQHFGERFGRQTNISPLGEAAEQVDLDPLSVLGLSVGGRSAIARGGEQLEKHLFPAVVKAGQVVDKAGPAGKGITTTAAAAHDFLGVHSAAKRELARVYGPGWLDKYAEYRAKLMQTGGDPTPEKFVVASTGTVKPSAARTALGPSGLPQSAVEFISPSKSVPEPIYRASPMGTVKPKPRPGRPVGKIPRVDYAEPEDPENALQLFNAPRQRQIGPVVVPRNTGLAQRRGGLGAPLPQRPVVFVPPDKVPPEAIPRAASLPRGKMQGARPGIGPAPIPKSGGTTFQPERENRILEMMRKPPGIGGLELPGPLNTAQDIFTSGLFVQPLGHQANITALGALADPLATGRAIGRGVVDTAKQLVGKGESEADIAARHSAAQRGGAISTHSTERANPIVDLATMLTNAGDKYGIPGKIATAIPRAVRGLYKWSGDSLWKFDDEVKAQRFQTLTAGGMSPERAGLRVGGELVDYENKSPVGRALRPVAPFSTWRTKAPLAVARNVIENPGRAAAINRAVPAAFGGSQGTNPTSGKPYTSSLPLAELNELLTTPGKYALGSQGVVPRLGVDTIGYLESLSIPPGRGRSQEQRQKALRTQDTYGVEAPTFALNSSPIAGTVMDFTGGGMFQKGQQPDPLTDLLNLIRVHP